MLTFLSLFFFVLGFVLCYRLWLAPLLRTRPSFKEFYARTDSFWKAVWLKIAFLKTKLLAALLMVASGLVGMYDNLAPLAVNLGVDWTPLTSKIPGWAYPIASFAIGALFYWLRKITEKEQATVIAAVQDGASVHEAVLLTATETAPQAPPDSGL